MPKKMVNKIARIGSSAVVLSVMELLSVVAQKYREQMARKQLSYFTLKHEFECLAKILKEFGDVPIANITTAMLETVFDRMREVGLKPNTINGRIKALRRLMDFAVEFGYIPANPALSVVKVRHIQEDIPSLSVGHVLALLRQPDLSLFTGYRDFTMIRLMLDTGTRLRETLDLTVGQVDLKARKLIGVLGKNRRVEDIPLSQVMCKTLTEYLEIRKGDSEDPLFISLNGTPYNRRTFQQRLKEYGSRAGITNVRVSPHTLRHTFAKHWILNGGDVFSLQKILRHSTMDMVRRYVALWGTEVQQQHDRFSPLLKWDSDFTDGRNQK